MIVKLNLKYKYRTHTYIICYTSNYKLLRTKLQLFLNEKKLGELNKVVNTVHHTIARNISGIISHLNVQIK